MDIKTEFRSAIRFQTNEFKFGITAENEYFAINSIAAEDFQKVKDHKSKFFIDFDFPKKLFSTWTTYFDMKNKKTEAIVFEFKFDNISFINFLDKNVMISFKYPPKSRLADDSEKNSFPRLCDLPMKFPWRILNLQPINALMRDCSAFIFETSENLSTLENMLKLSNIIVTKKNFVEKSFPNIPKFKNTYCFQMVKSLGYPGQYMMYRYGCHEMENNNNLENLLTNIWYHVIKNRELQTCTILTGNAFINSNNNVRALKKVIITPTRKIFAPPAPTSFCHIFRIVDLEKIIEVSFEADDGDKGNNRCLSELAALACINGIEICGQKYFELGCSNSKFREKGSFFYRETKEKVLSILKSLGKFDKALPAKIASRIGLNFTSVLEGLYVPDFKIHDDILSSDKKYNFTDGCGQMSRNFALNLMKHLKLRYLPSAVQFRFPGFKGVLLLNNKQEIPIIFRQNQKKFDAFLNDKQILDIVKYSAPAGCKLNKNSIEILCQNAEKHGDKIKKCVENKIEEYFKNSIKEAIDKTVDSKKFVQTLESLPKYMNYIEMKSYTPDSFLSEPFFRQMVQADARMQLSKFLLSLTHHVDHISEFIDEKKQVRVPRNFGRTAIGAADFNGCLKPGEVFFQYSEKLDAKCKNKIIHVGPVAITRSPMYSLGDIRFVQAVDCAGLHHIVDVLIFPTCGDRPIQDEISGGDLDGDEYVIFWDHDLMLRSSQPAAEFEHPKASEELKIEIDQVQERFPEFRKEYMQNDAVGLLSNNHTILAELFGYDNEYVIKLAHKVDVSLVYFKNGIQAKNIEFYETSTFDPDHMMKYHKPMYCLDNKIGSIHRGCRNIIEEIEELRRTDESVPVIDPSIDIHGWNEWTSDAEACFEAFKTQVDILLLQNDLKSTGELFSNRIFKFALRSYEVEIQSAVSTPGFVQKMVFDLMRTFRENILTKFVKNWKQIQIEKDVDFFDFYLPQIPTELKKYAVACYRVAYKDGKYLAFPWILWDVLDTIRRSSRYDFSSTFANININSHTSSNLFQYSKSHPGIPIILADVITRFGEYYDLTMEIERLFSYLEQFINIKKIVFEKVDHCFETFVKFCQYYGIEIYEDFMKCRILKQFAKACRLVLFKMAFKLKRSIFGKPSNKTLTTNFLKTTTLLFEIDKSLEISSLSTEFLRLTNCQNILINTLKVKKFSTSYQIFALGNQNSIAKLRDLLTIKIDKNDAVEITKNHELKVQSADKKIQTILNDALNSL